MPLYAVKAAGWMMLLEADNKEAALHLARQSAGSASLLPSDISFANIHRANDADVDWYRAMAGPVEPQYPENAELDEHERRMKVARRMAAWELGDTAWADQIVNAYLRPGEAVEYLDKEGA